MVTTDAAGHATFSISLPGIALGNQITATATGPQGASEHGPCRTVAAAVPTISIDDVEQLEGDAGTSVFRFTVTRSSSEGTSGVHFATADGSAKAGSDYVAHSGDLSFAEGQTQLTIDVLVNGDTTFELNEGFLVRLSAPAERDAGGRRGLGTDPERRRRADALDRQRAPGRGERRRHRPRSPSRSRGPARPSWRRASTTPPPTAPPTRQATTRPRAATS